jgi:hypothetical protein
LRSIQQSLAEFPADQASGSASPIGQVASLRYGLTDDLEADQTGKGVDFDHGIDRHLTSSTGLFFTIDANRTTAEQCLCFAAVSDQAGVLQ